MLDILIDLSLFLYLLGVVCFLFSYALEGARYYLRSSDQEPRKTAQPDKSHLPFVTLQLPVCNELYVVERLIESCCRLDYPTDRLEIQVLDDSSDGTTTLIADSVAEYAAKGFHITHLRRGDRAGFKAGNLEHGRRSARGEFVAVLDADCVPDRDFLLKTLPYFEDASVGIVQASTRHMNRDHSILTRAQDPFDAAASVAPGDVYGGHCINVFSGSPGLLRAACLLDAGGWQLDTLAEDQDVSIRAYLKGWRCIQLQECLAGDELQERMVDFKNRVARCNQGPAECYRKHLLGALSTRGLSAFQKASLLPTLHCYWLSLSSVSLLALASVPLVLLRTSSPLHHVFYAIPFVLSSGLIMGVAGTRNGRALATTILLYIGTSFRGGWGALSGLLGIKSSFTRTTKRGSYRSASSSERPLYGIRVTPATFLEGVLALYFLAAFVLSFQSGNFWFVPLHALCFTSCSFVFVLSMADLW